MGWCWAKGWRPWALELLSASPEIKGSLYSLPSYWQWLRKTKLREYNREGTDEGKDQGVPRSLGKGVYG